MSDKKSIHTFSIEELYARADSLSDAVFYEGCIIGHPAPHDGTGLLRYPIRIDAHLICLCRESGSVVMSNLTRVGMKRNSLVALPPANVICIDNAAIERNGEMTVFAFAPEFLDKINLDFKHTLPLVRLTGDTLDVELTEHEITVLESALEGVRKSVIYFRSSRFYHEIVRRAIESVIYMIIDVLSRSMHRRAGGGEAAPKNRNDEYFGRFIKCLYENYKTERSVAFYASQLHITPKYMTTIIRRVSGRTAAEWIDDYVILEAKNLLRYSSMSIQEVAYALNFSNQSFFGKYFKLHTSMSPSQYKMQK